MFVPQYRPVPSFSSRCARLAVPPLLATAILVQLAGPAFAADTTPPAPVTGMKTTADTSRIKLDWANSTEADRKGYLVYRSASADGTFTKVTANPVTSSEFADYAAPKGFPTFYRVTAVDTSGNESTPVNASGTRKDGVKPVVPKALTATRTDAGITLDWADNAEADLAGYIVSRATSSGGTYTKLTASPTATSQYVDTTAAAGTNYWYRVVAVDFSGYTSSTVRVAALVPDSAAPAAVRGMKVTAGTSSIKLDWSSNSESDLAGYHVYRASEVDGTFTKLTATPRTASDFTDSTAGIGVVSYYRVVAVDRSGNESAPVAASGTRKDGVKPLAPTALVASGIANGVLLDWADNTDPDLAGYIVSRATSSGGTYTKLTATPIPESTFTDTTAPAGRTSYYRVSAVDVSGNISSVTSASAAPTDELAPAPVRGMVTSADTSRVKLDWTNNTESDLAGYNVYRATTADGEYTKLTATPRTSSDYPDTLAPIGVTSFYKVTAVDKSGNESPAVSASNTRRDGTAPVKVTGLTAAGTATDVTLDWADSPETDLAGYVVSRATSSGGTYTKLTATPITESTFADTTATEGTTYWYRVSAVDLSGNTSAVVTTSGSRLDTTAPAPATGLTAVRGTGQVTLTWTASASTDVASYDIYRTTGEGATKVGSAPAGAPSYVDSPTEESQGYTYFLRAVDASGNVSADSDVVSVAADTTPPAAPTALVVSGTAESVTLDWADSAESDLAGYLVERAETGSTEFVQLTADPVSASTYLDASPLAVPATYRVTAVDTAGNTSTAATGEFAPVSKTPVAGADVTVAQDGSGDHTTIAAALAAAPSGTAPFVIGIKPGTYRELLTVSRANVTLLGAGGNARDVVISYDNAAGTPKPDGSGTYGTSGSATVLIKANDVTTRNLTIENSFDEAAVTLAGGEQAVALKTSGDRLVFDNVRLLGDQDTLYADSPAVGALARSYYVNSYIEGDVDFIFGRGTAVFDRSTIHASTRGSSSNNGYVTAPSTDKSLTYGYLITDSTITSDAPASSFHLGRPWQPSGDANAVAQVVIRNTELPAAIKAAPWTDMSTTFSWRNARFFEYGNTGAGAAVNADRPQLSDLEATKYTKFTYLAGADGWNPTGQTPPPPPADTTAPAAVAGLSATAADSKVDLTWIASAEADLAGYHVYRSTTETVALTAANRLTTATVSGTSYSDRTAANGTTYTYVVTAVDRTGNESVASTSVTGAPVGVPLPAHDILVAADGTGQYTTVSAAISAAPAGTAAKPTVIAVKPGTYKEMITVAKSYVTVIGTTGDPRDVVLTYDNAAGTTLPGGTGTYGTGKSQSVLVSGSNVTVKDLTIENSFDEAAVVLAGGEQAVALKTTGDRLVFDNVRLLGNQDTLLADSPNAFTVARSYYVNSYIEGDVDFIFGRGTAVFDRTTIHALTRGSSSNNGYITAASTSDQNPYGFLIINSTVTSNAPANSFHLGRPWRGWADGTQVRDGVTYNSRGQVTIRNTALPAAVKATQPWTDMSPNLWTDGRFFEYQNTGAGAAVNATRPQLTDEQAPTATAQAYLGGSDGWNPVG